MTSPTDTAMGRPPGRPTGAPREAPAYCGHCGEERRAPDGPTTHDRCDRAVLLEPPRFCGHCRRRMVVQVMPTGWTARCSRHGEVSGGRR